MKATFIALVLTLVLASCAGMGSSNTKRLLSASGFQPRKPANEEQTALYDRMEPYKLYNKEMNGKMVYGYKDSDQGVVYVGGAEEHEKYQRLAVEQQIARDQRAAAEIEMEASLGWSRYGWGAWSPYQSRIYY
ncbi:hypothetical protein [Haloferula sp. A504]|uniref:hypothetical protein n=1 Tax=Haloferula sp. A504 TaxID=3373601 RepID=UPI0031C87E5C|nr:hypothetical protein [Verrucomicrobiaceae bacterium E54]